MGFFETEADAIGLNPFMNQVYFYIFTKTAKMVDGYNRLNPFMNQVYFYFINLSRINRSCWEGCLNPFMNQVYFYSIISHRNTL